MEEKELLSVKEFARQAGLTVQTVYKHLRNPKSELSKYVVIKDDKKYVKREALDTIEEKRTPEKAESEILQDMVDLLKEQLEMKDNQIQILQEQNKELTAALQTTTESLQLTTENLSAAQALHAGTLQQQMEDAAGDHSETNENGESTSTDKKKGFFARFFGK